MNTRVFHGDIRADDVATALVVHFNQGNLTAQHYKKGDQILVQIATHRQAASGGKTNLTITLRDITDGIMVEVGRQSWLGVAASLGTSAITTIYRPLNLISRLDDIVQDIENLQMTDQVWDIITQVARLKGASFELSERLRTLSCAYCLTANPVGVPNCLACGAPLGEDQPRTCMNCGFAVRQSETKCPNCGRPLA